MVQLRKRASKVAYSKTYSFGSDEEAGPSNKKSRGYESDGSASAFSAGSQPPSAESEPISDAAESAESGVELDPGSGSDAGPSSKKPGASGGGFGAPKKKTGLQTLLAPQRHANLSSRQNELLALQHNSRPLHCPQPLYLPSKSTARLTRQPSLFDDDTTTAEMRRREDTTDYWGDVVGPGPFWRFVEDKAWFKEFAAGSDQVSDQATRQNHANTRPRIYDSIRIAKDDITILTLGAAEQYLPNGGISSTESEVRCSTGPFGSQTARQIPIFGSIKGSESFDSNNSSHVFNTGAPVWALDWCPTSLSEKTQYLAIGPSSSRHFTLPLGTRVSPDSFACIQIWSLRPSGEIIPEGVSEDRGEVSCELVLGVDCGPALSLKWCPLPSNDLDLASDAIRIPKLGVLGGVFADGSLRFYAVPHPKALQLSDSGINDPSLVSKHPFFVRLNKALLIVDLEESPIWSFDWANGDTVAIGATSGTILVYNVREHLSSDTTDPLLPSLVKSIHQSGIRSLAWVRVPPSDSLGRFVPGEDPTMICSVGYDGEIFLTDTRDQSSVSLGRYRDVINTVKFSPWAGGCILPESDSVKWFNFSPVVFGRGRHIFSSTGPIWDVAASDFHPFVAVAASDGALRMSNMLRVSRKGYNTPKFIYKLYQIEYNRNTKEYRMLERFHPTGPDHLRASKGQAGPAPKGKKKKKHADDDDAKGSISSSSWPPEVGIICAAWNPNGLTKCQLLASGTASGLCRIDNLWSSGRRADMAGKGKEKEKDEDGDGESVVEDEMEVDEE